GATAVEQRQREAARFVASRPRSDQVVLDGEERGGASRGDADLSEEALVVVVHGPVGDAELFGDLLVDQAAGEKAEYLGFALREAARQRGALVVAGGVENGVDGGAIEA